MRLLFFILTCISATSSFAQTWVDSVDVFSRTVYLPPNQFLWSWQHAPMLHAAEIQYNMMPEAQKDQYLTYVKRSMDRSTLIANGTSPNAIASANGMAFLYRITGDPIYLQISEQVYIDYLNSLRTSNGGVSHVTWAPELWDDSIYMIGVFFMAMYRATNDEQYITELIAQFIVHKEKLVDTESGLWVHGWDDNDVFNFDFCSQENWADEETRRSHEFWGRGNGWIVVTLSELLNTLEQDHPHWDFAADALLEMLEMLPQWQDETTGHWFQLPARAGEAGNFLESSSTAMFAYGMVTAMKHGLVADDFYENNVIAAYEGIRDHSILPHMINSNEYYTSKNVCGGTCIGDKDYYFDRAIVNGEAYALAMFVIFGRAYEEMYFTDVISSVNNDLAPILNVAIFPSPMKQDGSFKVRFSAGEAQNISVEVIDVLGRNLFSRSITALHGINTMAITLNDALPGNYMLIIKNMDEGVLASFSLSKP